MEKLSHTNTGLEYYSYKFAAKNLDEETGLYYFGARYLDVRYSRWISTDPALSDYISGSSVGCGGIYNSMNLSFYHYANNNPIRYSDPTGAFDWDTNTIETGDTLNQIAEDCNTRYGTNYTADDLQGLNSDTISDKDKIYAGNHLNLGKAEDVQKRAKDYVSRATAQVSQVNGVCSKMPIDNGSLKTWFNKKQGELLTPKEIQIQRTCGITEMIAGPVLAIGACEVTYGASVEIGLYIMADGAVLIAKADEGVKQAPFVFFINLKSPVTGEINGVPVNVEVPNPSYIMPRVK